jgi:hypothetical protein
MAIAGDATIATIWPLLTNARDYVAGVRRHMLDCHRLQGAAHVRIAVTGTGQRPSYRIFFPTAFGGRDIVYGSYWDNHRPLGEPFARNESWSTSAMSLAEVDALLREKLNPKTG